MDRKTKRVTLRLPVEADRDLRLLAEQRGVSMSVIVRGLLERYLERNY